MKNIKLQLDEFEPESFHVQKVKIKKVKLNSFNELETKSKKKRRDVYFK